ncbi:MAG: HAD-IA family hydrolase [Candidatus Nanopelagicales bacterium]
MQVTTRYGDVREIRGVLFDMDGTLVDSTAATERTWRAWAEQHGVEDRLTILHGPPAIATVRSCFPDATDDELDRLWRWQVDAERTDLDGVVAMSGAHDLLRWLGGEVPWIVVTSADLALAQARLGAAEIEAPGIVSVEDVTFGKPHPEPFITGARRLGLDVAQCLVVEDAAAGVTAGLSSGAVTAALNGHPADLAIDDLAHLHFLLANG